MRTVRDKSGRENKNTHCVFNKILSGNHAMYELMLKNMVEPDRPHTNIIGQMHIACRITKNYRHTLRICNTYCFFMATIVTQMHFNIMLHVHCLSSFFMLLYVQFHSLSVRVKCLAFFMLLLSVSKGAEISRLVSQNTTLPSASAQVRQYLRGLWKKKPLEKTVEKCQENYGECWQNSTSNGVNVNTTDCQESRLENHASAAKSHSEENMTTKKKVEHELKLRM